MSNPTLQMYKAKSLLVLLTLWTTGHALGCPRPTFLLSGISHTELSLPVRRSCMGLPLQSCSQSPTLATQLMEPQLKARRMTLLGQKVVGVVGSPQHGPQHGQQCIIPADSWKAPTGTSDTGSSFLSIAEEGGSGRR